MSIKDQLSKVRMFQTELSMLRTRFREFHESQGPASYFYLPVAGQRLADAQEWLVREAKRLKKKQ